MATVQVSFRYYNMSAYVKADEPVHCIIRNKGPHWRVIAAFHASDDAYAALEALSKGEAR